METLTGVVCDDAAGFRALMSALLTDAGVHVVARGETWPDAVQISPGADVVVVDLWMPDFDPQALGRVRAAAPDATLAVVTALDLTEARQRVAGTDVDLLLSKLAPPAKTVARIVERAREARGAADT